MFYYIIIEKIKLKWSELKVLVGIVYSKSKDLYL